VAFEPKQVLAYERVDEFLSLSLTLGGKGPHCVIENLATGKKKLVRLSWVESGKGLQIKTGKKELRSYDADTIFRASRSLVAQLLTLPLVRDRFRHKLNFFLGALHEPRSVLRERDLRVLSEDRRRGLWLACFPELGSPGVLRPCFPFQGEEERLLLSRGRDHGAPWGFGFDLDPGERGLGPLKRHGMVAALVKVHPQRWFYPVVATVAALLTGLSQGSSGDEEEETALSLLWNPLMAGHKPDPEEDLRLASLASRLLEGLRLYIRHFYRRKDVGHREILDGEEILKGEGYGRRERFEDGSGALGRHIYSVSRYVRDDGGGALICQVKGATYPPKEDVVLTFGPGVYEGALRDDSCGGLEDGRFTTLNIFRMVQMHQWLKTVERALGDPATLP